MLGILAVIFFLYYVSGDISQRMWIIVKICRNKLTMDLLLVDLNNKRSILLLVRLSALKTIMLKDVRWMVRNCHFLFKSLMKVLCGGRDQLSWVFLGYHQKFHFASNFTKFLRDLDERVSYGSIRTFQSMLNYYGRLLQDIEEEMQLSG